MRILMSLAITVLAASLMPAMAQEDTCYVVECWPIPGGQRCLRHCFDPQPQYYAPPEEEDAPPEYQEPEYETPQEPQEEASPAYEPPSEPTYSAPQQRVEATAPLEYPPFIVIAVLGIVVLLIVAGLADTESTAMRRRTAEAEEDATTARDLTRHAERGAQEIDTFIEHAARDLFDRGREAADKEWTRE